MKLRENNAGYIALSSILVVLVLTISIGISVALASISDAQISLSSKKSFEELDITDSCINEALLELNEDESISSSISLPEGNCSVTIDSQAGNDWTFTVTSNTTGTQTKSVQVSVTRDTTVTVNSWQEL